MDQLEKKEATVKDIYVDCEQYGAQYGDIQKFIKDLLLGLTSNIQVIRENQTFIRNYLETLKEVPQEIKQEKSIEKPIEEIIETLVVKPATQAMSTQTFTEQPTDNIMVIQSVSDEGETIQIYNKPYSHEEGKEDDRNVIVEAKYIRGQSGDPKRASELVLRNVPKHFETTFVEPDETTTEITVDPDGTKRIIVKKLTRTTQQIVKHEEYDAATLPEHIHAQLGLSGTTHDFIVGTPDNALEQHSGITESSLSAVIEHVSHRVIRKTRKIIKKIVIIDGQEHITEEVIEEPDEVEEFSENRPAIEYETIEKPTTEIVQTVIIERSEESVPEILEVQQMIAEVLDEAQQEVKISEVQQIQEPTVIPDVMIAADVEAPSEAVTETPVIEGENQPDQVFKVITEAPVELSASELDNLAPIEDIKDIWPYETPYIASQPTITEIVELPAPTQHDNDSQSIWPQNLTIGSNIDFNEYSFDCTLEKSADYLDINISETPDPGLNVIEEISDHPMVEEILKTEEVEERKLSDLLAAMSIEPEPEPEIPEPQIADVIETQILEEPPISDLVEEKSVPEESRPISPPQIATVTIIKTMTFLEQERINAEATMIVTTEPPISEKRTEAAPIQEIVEQTIESIENLPQEPFSPEEILQEIIDVHLVPEKIPEQDDVAPTMEASVDQTDKAVLSQVEMFIEQEASTPNLFEATSITVDSQLDKEPKEVELVKEEIIEPAVTLSEPAEQIFEPTEVTISETRIEQETVQQPEEIQQIEMTVRKLFIF